MRVSKFDRVEEDKLCVRDHNPFITLAYGIFSIVFLAVAYSASTSAGMASSELASMSAFP